jgi:ethanolamine phosphate phosphodiesterase
MKFSIKIKKMKRFHRLLVIPAGILLFTLFFNEYIIYWQIMSKCNWPLTTDKNKFLHVMLLADTHLLGSRNGHWFDKLRREWQMRMSFQTSQFYLKPDYVIILGDLTDEGKWCSDREWAYYEKRVADLFHTTESTKMLVVAGNHDVGFHYDMIQHKLNRFNRTFNSKFIQLHSNDKFNVHFVLANSMSLENDGCTFCNLAQNQMKEINETFKCLKTLNNDSVNCGLSNRNLKYSKPVLLTHFPLYRTSDISCPSDIDSEIITKGKLGNYKSNWDCLSKDSTKTIIDKINPRLVS